MAQETSFQAEVNRLVKTLPRTSSPKSYGQIVLAYDGSPGARAALDRVATVAAPDSQVTVVTVIPFESVGSQLDPIKPELRDWQWRTLTEAAALLARRGIKAFIEAAAGNPAPVILETARALDADLVVCGRGRDRWWHPTVKGRSIRRHLVRSLTCDALVVASKDNRPRNGALVGPFGSLVPHGRKA
jgi:nucleotide-binding universal stress UspA family protein